MDGPLLKYTGQKSECERGAPCWRRRLVRVLYMCCAVHGRCDAARRRGAGAFAGGVHSAGSHVRSHYQFPHAHVYHAPAAGIRVHARGGIYTRMCLRPGMRYNPARPADGGGPCEHMHPRRPWAHAHAYAGHGGSLCAGPCRPRAMRRGAGGAWPLPGLAAGGGPPGSQWACAPLEWAASPSQRHAQCPGWHQEWEGGACHCKCPCMAPSMHLS